MSFRRYRKYKDSGVEWLGEVPGHWDVKALKNVISRIESGVSVNAIDTPAAEGEIGVLKTSCVYRGWFDPAENKAVVPEDYERVACPVTAGTLIVSRMNTPDLVGAAGMVGESHPGLFLPDRLWQVHFADAHAAFIHYWTHSPLYRAQVQQVCAGASSSMQNLAQDQFRAFTLALPPAPEQKAIAAFLDRETAKIDALVAEQQNLIVLLKEKRQALISYAVTKGLDPDVPMKDSGVAWLGEVPAHWHIKPLMRLTEPGRPIMYGIVLPGPDVLEGVPIVKGGNVKPSRLRLDALARTTAEIEAPYARARLRAGDLVYAIRGTIGDCEIVPPDLNNANITQDVARVALSDQADNRWARYALLSDPLREELACGSLGAAVRGVNIFDLKRVRVPTPPLDEQVKIADALDAETASIEALIVEAECSTGLLQERRTALISAAVTGKIDVRHLAFASAEPAPEPA